MNSRYILGIDTSNYKTSVAIIDTECNILCDLRRFLTVKEGEKGLRQSDALFQHIRNLPELLEEAMSDNNYHIGAISFSSKPRPVKNSYMPVFFAGESYARSLAAVLSIPSFAFSHQEGHIEAIKAFSKHSNKKELLACHFSGGTCEMLSVKSKHTGYDIDIIGGSKDISFGQVIDRTGVQLGMSFPAGEEMDRLALASDEISSFLTPIKVKEGWLNLSGIDTQIKRLTINMDIQQAQPVIKELFEKVADAMTKMIFQCAEKTGITDVIMAGGVTSSLFIRDKIVKKLAENHIDTAFGQADLAQDNAIGTAILGGKIYGNETR